MRGLLRCIRQAQHHLPCQYQRVHQWGWGAAGLLHSLLDAHLGSQGKFGQSGLGSKEKSWELPRIRLMHMSEKWLVWTHSPSGKVEEQPTARVRGDFNCCQPSAGWACPAWFGSWVAHLACWETDCGSQYVSTDSVTNVATQLLHKSWLQPGQTECRWNRSFSAHTWLFLDLFLSSYI